MEITTGYNPQTKKIMKVFKGRNFLLKRIRCWVIGFLKSITNCFIMCQNSIHLRKLIKAPLISLGGIWLLGQKLKVKCTCLIDRFFSLQTLLWSFSALRDDRLSLSWRRYATRYTLSPGCNTETLWPSSLAELEDSDVTLFSFFPSPSAS